MSDWFATGSGQQVDVPALFDGPSAEGVWALVQYGALVSIGTTADGGALGVTVTVDGRWRREFFRDSEELKDWIMEALPHIQAACEARRLAQDAAKPQRSRKRSL